MLANSEAALQATYRSGRSWASWYSGILGLHTMG